MRSTQLRTKDWLEIRHCNESTPIERLVLSACQTASGDDWAALGLAVRSGTRSPLTTSDQFSTKQNSALLRSNVISILNGDKFSMMARTFWQHLLVSISVLCFVELGALPHSLNSVSAESAWETSAAIEGSTPTIDFIPPDDGDPGDTASGGTRGRCSEITATAPEEFRALLPESNRGLTLHAHPTFFVYVPQTSAKAIFFQLQDERERVRYQTIVPINDRPGIVSIELPSSAPALELDLIYLWSAVALCEYDGGQLDLDTVLPFTPNDPWVQGWVRRVEPNADLQGHIDSEASLELAALYAAKGIWFDTLAVLATLRRAQPENSRLVWEWETLLQSVGLDSIASQPFIE